MALLDDLASALGEALAPLARPAVLHRAGSGGFADLAIRAQPDLAGAGTEGAAPGREIRALVPIAAPFVLPTTDDEMTLGGIRYRIAAVEADATGAYAVLRGHAL
ncbi:head-tail joining protein [Methylobacterium oryzihabitans]|uniref:Uncharacterized protein n=1 Tax=Methylobacterium oryzihabitans TaxID=2499852 RepID=A0A3S2XSD7_9HYPH|nr:hypothetical protein [Methylobacterium oryzihabitans]RVU21784.1 hypothetical protein EOE48_01685 [Methylobacterium oryzihabitans]